MRTPALPTSRSVGRAALVLGSYLLVYVLLDGASLAFRTNSVASLWYLPDGASLALLLLFGVGYAPAIIVTSLITSFLTYPSSAPAVVLVVWSVLFPLPFAVTASLLRRGARIGTPPRHLRDVILLIFGCLSLSVFLAGMFTLTVVVSSGGVPSAEAALATLPAVAFQWWIGEAIGVLVVTPLLVVTVIPWLTWRLNASERRARPRPPAGIRLAGEASAQVLSIAAVLVIVFGLKGTGYLPLLYLCFLPLIWITLRHALRGATLAIALIDAGALLAERISGIPSAQIAELQVFMLILALTGLILGAVVDERRESEAQTHRSEARLVRALASITEVVGLVSETRDPYTAGHQRRVSELSVAIARKLGMTEAQEEEIRLAAIMHDVGKISVPAEILSKPGMLSPLEIELIRGHAEAGYRIIAGAHLEGPTAEIVYQHHERCDGSGYPRGLAGDDLLPGAKVIMVADVVEAMESNRPYRAALGVEAALDEVEDGAGSRYDADVTRACVGLFRKDGFKFSDL